MSISSVSTAQTIRNTTTDVDAAKKPGTVTDANGSGAFSLASLTGTGQGGGKTAASNPLQTLSADLQSALLNLQSQSSGGQDGKTQQTGSDSLSTLFAQGTGQSGSGTAHALHAHGHHGRA